MLICLLIVTRNASAAVKTLHNILNINTICLQNNVQIEINFVNDDPFEKTKTIMKKLKTSDRLVFIDYGVSMDIETTKRVIQPFETGWHGVVFPAVCEGVDWDMFKDKLKNKCEEPIEQIGLNFDTDVEGKMFGEDNYKVKRTIPKCWILSSKAVCKVMKGPKGSGLSIPAQPSEMFEKFLSKGLKLYAYTGARLNITYQHECLGNILNMTGVTKD
jgi:hypothetical protein